MCIRSCLVTALGPLRTANNSSIWLPISSILKMILCSKSYLTITRCPSFLVKWKGFPNEESSWEPVAHLGNSMEFVEEFHQANPTKPSQATLERALKKAAEKEARKKARAEAARQAQEARKRKAKEALAGRPKRCSERLQSKIGSKTQ